MSANTPPESSIESVISGVAAQTGAGNLLTPEDLKALADRVELLSADFGRWAEYKAASVEYIGAFKAEADWHRRIRLAVSIACGLLVLFLSICLVLGMIFSKSLFSGDSGHALTALIVTTVSGCVVVTVAATKGAFATLADRNAGLPMPEHIKELVDAGKNLLGGGHA